MFIRRRARVFPAPGESMDAVAPAQIRASSRPAHNVLHADGTQQRTNSNKQYNSIYWNSYAVALNMREPLVLPQEEDEEEDINQKSEDKTPERRALCRLYIYRF
jgi:hypothetical protein